MKELYVSVDVETDGPIPGPFSMVSLGAVVIGMYDSKKHTLTRFDLDDPENCFRYDFKPISDQWEPEALAISGYPREHFEKNGREPREAMTEFANGLRAISKKYGASPPIFVGFPLGFDWMFTYWYLVNFAEGGSPFGHSRHLDIKTEYASQFNKPIGLSVKREMPREIMSRRPHTHDPLDDAREQGELALNLLERRYNK